MSPAVVDRVHGLTEPPKLVWVRLDCLYIRDPGKPSHTNGGTPTSVGEDFLGVASVPGTAESPDGSAPGTGDVHDYVPALPGGAMGATMRCRVRQTFRLNTDFDTGPRSTITECALASP